MAQPPMTPNRRKPLVMPTLALILKIANALHISAAELLAATEANLQE